MHVLQMCAVRTAAKAVVQRQSCKKGCSDADVDVSLAQVVQPEGPSFQVDGHNVVWQQWHLHVGFNFREGLVLSHIGYGMLPFTYSARSERGCMTHILDVCISVPVLREQLPDGTLERRRYEDQGRVRPVCHRASTVEIIVPYGDPRPPFNRKCAFDAMDYGLGACANSLELGCDCLGAIQYFDGVVTTGAGERCIACGMPWTTLPQVCLARMRPLIVQHFFGKLTACRDLPRMAG